MKKNDLLKLQKTETRILYDIDKFCSTNGIKYSVFAGTAIGAVRHHGFIPWDDDTDICMLRNDYERFIDLFKLKPIDGYYLQSTRIEDKTNINHCKVKKNGTHFVSENNDDISGHDGIFLDIFALDIVPKDKYKRVVLLFWAKVRLLYTRNKPLTRMGKKYEFLSKLLLMIPNNLKLTLRRISEKQVTRYKDGYNGDFDLMALVGTQTLSTFFPKSTLKETIDIGFDGHIVKITSNYDEMLKAHYGNYMELPPKEERINKHMPKYISF